MCVLLRSRYVALCLGGMQAAVKAEIERHVATCGQRAEVRMFNEDCQGTKIYHMSTGQPSPVPTNLFGVLEMTRYVFVRSGSCLWARDRPRHLLRKRQGSSNFLNSTAVPGLGCVLLTLCRGSPSFELSFEDARPTPTNEHRENQE